MSSLAVNAITDASGGTTASINGHTPTASNMAGKNRIINGDCRIDQRNAGASVSLVSGGGYSYSADRWYAENATDGTASIQQVADAPNGFSHSIKWTVTATDTSIAATQAAWFQQRIEGFNFADMGFGSASAKTLTVSFWVKSSVTGTFGGALANSAYNRAYSFSYTINAANTWEYKTVTIAGDTTGTWIGATNGIGCRLSFAVSAGSDRSASAGSWGSFVGIGAAGQVNLMATNGATFYLTGVQLEASETASEFSLAGGGQYGQELALCQRYYTVEQSVVGSFQYYNHLRLPVSMRAAPTVGTITFDTGTGATFGAVAGTSTISLYQATNHSSIGTAQVIPLSAEL